jgi:hypothetical protein
MTIAQSARNVSHTHLTGSGLMNGNPNNIVCTAKTILNLKTFDFIHETSNTWSGNTSSMA